jgi:hypothetical protein
MLGMTNELVTLTESNPMRGQRRPDGTWSARDVQESGAVHATWRRWEEAVLRARELLTTELGETAAQDHIASTGKMISLGKGGQREVADYVLTALGLFAVCQQSRLPELDLWFTYAGLHAAGYGKETVDVHAVTLTELEKMADGYVAQGERIGVSLVPLLVELYVRRAWETYSMTIGAYFRDYRGIGPDRFTLPRVARREFVTLMATAAPEAPNAHLALISGNSLRTVTQDRSELGVANPGRVEGQRAVTSRKEPVGKDPRESVGDTPEDDEFEAWQKLLKTLSREELLALRDMIDNLLDRE